MAQIVIYIRLEKYLAEWLTHSLGDPVKFPSQSNENAVIRAFLQQVPEGAKPQLGGEGYTAIVIPESKAKPPEKWHYLGPKGQDAVREAIKDLFTQNLWADLSKLENAMLLLKTGDGKVVELQPVNHRLYQETDSLSTSPVTGEIIEHWHYGHILEYRLTTTALNYFMAHGVIKLRLGTEDRWKEKSWKQDELGKNLSKVYKEILEELSPDYVPPKTKTIYDDF